MFLDISIRFPNLGIELANVGKQINIFGFEIAYYGIIIALGMVIGYLLVEWQAKRTGQKKDLYLDFAIYAIVLSVIGARIYYVAFAWDEFKGNPLLILDLRGGGLAIYGGIITGVITGIIYSKIKKISFWLLADTSCVGLLAGQIIGRWGNFFNREAFGEYTDNLLAMQLKVSEVVPSSITPLMLEHQVTINGAEYIQVHPTFLYESLWNVCILIGILLYTKRKKFDGELILIYFVFYGLGRAWMEGLRTDQLLLWGTDFPTSQLLSVLVIIISCTIIVIKRIKKAKQ